MTLLCNACHPSQLVRLQVFALCCARAATRQPLTSFLSTVIRFYCGASFALIFFRLARTFLADQPVFWLCAVGSGQMRLIALITGGTQIRRILEHIGVDSEPPQISPARGLPLWDDCDAHVDVGVAAEPDWDLAA